MKLSESVKPISYLKQNTHAEKTESPLIQRSTTQKSKEIDKKKMLTPNKKKDLKKKSYNRPKESYNSHNSSLNY